LAVLFFSFLCGCNGGAALPPPSGLNVVPPGVASAGAPAATTIANVSSSSGARLAAMQALAAYYQKLPHTSTSDDDKSLLGFIQKDRHAFSAAGVYDGQVWATFSGGEQLTIANSDGPVTAKDSRRVDSGSPTALRPFPIRVHCKSPMPACPRAYVLWNSLFFENNNDVAIAAALSDVGYAVISGNATIDQLKAVKSAHVLEIDSHGSVIPLVDRKGNPLKSGLYGLSTATVVSAKNEVKYAADIADQSIVYGLGVYENEKLKKAYLLPVYVATPTFFQKYVSFENDALDNSLAFFNTCFSASPDVEESFVNVLEAKGLATYLGWTKSVTDDDALAASENFYDRTLPEDVTQEVIPVTHLTPPESASDVRTAYAWMQSQDLTVSHMPINVGLPPTNTGSAATLELDVLPPGGPQLAPILNQVTLFEYNNDQPGTPWIAGGGEWGSPASASDIVWGIASKPLGAITAFPPPLANYLGPGDVRSTLPSSVTNGYVRLFEDGISSNAVPLTEWDGTVNVTETQTFIAPPYSGSVTLTATLAVGLRESVNPIRTGIGGDLYYPPTIFTDFTPNSSGTFGGSGTYSDMYGGSPASYSSTHESVMAGSNPSASSNAIFDAAQPGGTYEHTCGSENDNPAAACLWITGNGNDVATCEGGTFGGGSICPNGPAPSPIAWMFGNYNVCGPSGEAIPFTIDRGAYAYTLGAPEFSCPSGFLEGPASSSEASESTTYTFTFNPPKSPPTINTATGVETPNSSGRPRVKAKTR
jgi:hypothetical protein